MRREMFGERPGQLEAAAAEVAPVRLVVAVGPLVHAQVTGVYESETRAE